MKKLYLSLLVVLLIILIAFLFLRGDEDDWIKDSRGVYVKHGNPSAIPNLVVEQQKIIECAENLYNSEKETEFASQCLGAWENYAVDIVNVPRNADDDLEKNQCEDYLSGNVSHFIELDKMGEIVRIV